ncbi:MAG: hypothetical protein JO247_00500 [Chloroflexi bacterium]|nr:hypothetical protein [Chloroflexota bacterium]
MAVATGLLDLHLLTWSGVIKCRFSLGDTKAEVVATNLEGENMRQVLVDPFNPRHLYATSVTDVYSSEDGGSTWKWYPAGGVDYREIWTMSVHPTRPDEVYLGTLPAMVYVSENGGRSFRELDSFRNLKDYGRWTFPPAPHSPDIRCIALDGRVPDEIVVGVEEGGVVKSTDRGQTWQDIGGPWYREAFPEVNDPAGIQPYQPTGLLDGRVYRDVHWVVRDPSSLNRLFAATGFGCFRTDDGGQRWKRLDYGMERGYCVPMAVHKDKPNRLFLGVSGTGPTAWAGPKAARTGPFTGSRWSRDMFAQTGGAHAGVLRTDDFGETWKRLKNGLADDNPYMISGLDVSPEDPDVVFATFTDGTVYVSQDGGDSWRQIISGLDRVFGVRVALAV